ncbi:Fructose-1,6-bisphosphatase/inositol-1-monophosphatase [Paraconexibacter sp. AEG42_29]|uniref:Fructose-1, 6-bisphosphatase/inositol-1-monophosphatase n=2 Tax=Paraconexibacter sp. AEG42_29 TaxID=2997339 RepID=A0AAU7ARH9_9ACTN
MQTPPVTFRTETEAAIAAVQNALRTASGRVGSDHLTMKGARDIVTETDVVIEDALRTALSKTSAQDVVGEERGGRATDSAHWIVDPLCGTRNFASGIPLYCVNVALVENKRVTAAVVGDASTGDILIAEARSGAWALRRDAIHRLNATADSGSIIVEAGKSTQNRREHAARFVSDFVRADRWELLALSSTLSTAYVAAGRAAAYVQFFATTVHNAAGSLVATEAGATVTDIDGNPWTTDSDSLIASADPQLHDELLTLVHATTARP